ncbi:NAD(P)H-binding protein [Streptomyces sp. GMY02]|uniref:NAD(P)H-binding protein n=1 Tax=Streptomyces sp. GMY02 TaxID=1333528 RepID=UPI001C2BCF66|nr:NAD(P)H-binding protein [Streptomyces sp. GMY02]QXE33163.1 NAD(P)H-binding protein [Streptomyces sp. GMY02]
MILLTGVTGTVGRLVAERLRATLPTPSAAVPAPARTGEPVRLLARDPRRIAAFAGPRTEIVGGDFAEPDSLAVAMKGVRAAFLVTADPLAPAHDEHLIAAARSAGVRHVVKLSAQAVAEPDAMDLITRWQRRNEDLIRASGLEWTFLRPRSFMSNTLGWARSVREEGVVRGFGGASPNATVDPRDLADIAVLCLTGAVPSGRAHALTGPAAISPVQQVAALSEVLARPLRFAELTRDQAYERLLARYPAAVAGALMRSAERQRTGGKAGVEPTMEALLGRPAGSYRAWASDHRRAFQPA